MTKTAPERFHARFQRVLDHIDRNLDGDLGLEALSRVAAFSKHHFHRQFTALFGVPVHRYVQLVRMKRASYRLAFRREDSITEIAMDAGYDAPEAFGRAFRQRIGQVPTDFRKTPDWVPWRTALGPLTGARTMQNQNSFDPDDVAIIDFPATAVALMEHRGDPAALGDTIRRFIDWRKRTGIRAASSATYTVFHTDPDTVPAADYHIDLCAATARPVAGGAGVMEGLIPAGRCAVLRVTGSSDDLRPAATFLYRDWLPESGEEVRDFPLYAQRVRFFPDVPEHEAVTDLFLPLQ
ncbi:MAG: AraC family transcriptional regulator [Pseudomonadota bacterium]